MAACIDRYFNGYVIRRVAGWMDGWKDEGMDEWVDGRMDERTDGRMNGRRDGWRNACMYK
jgi:hypothetical protein